MAAAHRRGVACRDRRHRLVPRLSRRRRHFTRRAPPPASRSDASRVAVPRAEDGGMTPAAATAFDTLVQARHADPFSLLGPHATGDGFLIRAFQPHAETLAVL